MAAVRDQFLDLLAAGRLTLVRRETVSVADTTPSILVRPNARRGVLIVTNVSATQLDLDWEAPAIAANAGVYQLAAGETYTEFYDTRAGGIGEPIWGTLHAIKGTTGNVRVLEYEVRP